MTRLGRAALIRAGAAINPAPVGVGIDDDPRLKAGHKTPDLHRVAVQLRIGKTGRLNWEDRFGGLWFRCNAKQNPKC